MGPFAFAGPKSICHLSIQEPRRLVLRHGRSRFISSRQQNQNVRIWPRQVHCKPPHSHGSTDGDQSNRTDGKVSAAASETPMQQPGAPADASSEEDTSEPQGQIAQAMDMIDESEDDMAPLLTALEKARERAERMTKIRMANESEALEIAGMAIAMKDKVDSAHTSVEETLHAIKKREEQLKRLTASKSAIDEEELRLSQGDALASVDSPMSSDAASVGDWDIGSLRNASSRTGATELSADAKAWTEIQAASMIIKERMNAYTKDLTALQGKLEGLNERVVEAEQQYKEADAAAAAIMTTTEGAVRTEMEVKGIYEQVRLAVEAAQRGKMDQLASSGQMTVDIDWDVEKEEGAATPEEKEASDQHRSVAEATQEEIEKIDMEPIEFESEAQEDTAKPSWCPEPLMRTAAVVGAIAAAVALVAITPIGPWLADEFAIIGAAVAKVSALIKAIMERVPWPQPMEGEQGLWETITILFTSVIAVPSVIKFIPGGSAVLGFLIGGAVIGPFGLGLIQDVAIVKHLAEMGVVFLLFNIGLELSLERLQSLARVVFGMGLIHFMASTLAIAGVAHVIAGYSGPCSIIVGGALALSSTAVAMQVLQERGETATRHGRATFAVLLLQDLAVVVLLMLVPLLARGDSGGFLIIAKALGVAAVKAMVCITGIILTGRMLLRPLMRRIAALQNADIFAATTLLVILGCSALTQMSGLSLALGAFLAGLLMAETEYALQVESDIKPFKGLLLGLFFISVGMEISFSAFCNNMPMIIGSLFALIAGKTALMFAAGIPFGLSKLSAVRSGMYIAPGGEFAFVVLQEAAQGGLLASSEMRAIFFMVVLSMSITPYLALGGYVGKVFERKDVASLQPTESETAELKGHVIIMGFGRVGQTIAQLLSERLIPYVALDMRADRVIAAKAADLPVYFGDAGSPAVLQHVGAARAKCAVVTLDTPGANYRSVWAMNKNFPGAKIFVRAHDVEHGLNLEQAGATAVVPEILEPSLQLAAAVLGSLKMNSEEVSEVIDDFRRTHMSELSFLTKLSGGSLGYGFDTDHGGDGKGMDGSADTVKLDLSGGDTMDVMDDVILAQPAAAAELKGSGA